MFKNRKYRFVLPIALAGGCIGILCWIYMTGSDTARLFEFGIWTGFGTMVPGLLVAAGASDNTFEEGELYDAVRDASQKQERVRGTVPILVVTVLAGTLIILVSLAADYLILPLLRLAG
jgi:hypothetical protein